MSKFEGNAVTWFVSGGFAGGICDVCVETPPSTEDACYLPAGVCNIASSTPLGAVLVPILSFPSVFEATKCR